MNYSGFIPGFFFLLILVENLTKCGNILEKIIDRRTLMVYYKYKLVRFTRGSTE